MPGGTTTPIREKRVVLPRQDRLVRMFAEHMCNDAKQLVEDPETGQQRYRYVRTGTNHFSMAFTYNCIAADSDLSVNDTSVW